MSKGGQDSAERSGFRAALGQFATGVTVVTTRGENGERIGLTANSFNSASLDPPMVLWSLKNDSANFGVFAKASYFAVNVLAADQVEVSQQFSRFVEDRFAGLECSDGIGGAPLIAGCAAIFQCRSVHRYSGGDHAIFVGEVLDFEVNDRTPLVFHRGDYTVTLPRSEQNADDGEIAGGYVDDFLLPLLARAYRLFGLPFYEHLNAQGIPRDEWRVLATLSDQNCTRDELGWIIRMRDDILDATITSLRRQGMIADAQPRRDGRAPRLVCTPKGSRRVIELLAVAKAREADVLSYLPELEQHDFKHLLRRVISRLGGAGRPR
ncbi:flavin reductase [Candidatus Foliamicus sp.]